MEIRKILILNHEIDIHMGFFFAFSEEFNL